MDEHVIFSTQPVGYGTETLIVGRAPSFTSAALAVGLWQQAQLDGRLTVWRVDIAHWDGVVTDRIVPHRFTIRSANDPKVRTITGRGWVYVNSRLHDQRLGHPSRVHQYGFALEAIRPTWAEVLAGLGDLRGSHPETKATKVSVVLPGTAPAGPGPVTYVWDRGAVGDDLMRAPHLLVRHFGGTYGVKRRANAGPGSLTIRATFTTAGGRTLEVTHPVERFIPQGLPIGIPEGLEGGL